MEAATEAALVAALTGVLERARPAESRLTRVHEALLAAHVAQEAKRAPAGNRWSARCDRLNRRALKPGREDCGALERVGIGKGMMTVLMNSDDRPIGKSRGGA